MQWRVLEVGVWMGDTPVQGELQGWHHQGLGWGWGAPWVLAGASEGTMLPEIVVASAMSQSCHPVCVLRQPSQHASHRKAAETQAFLLLGFPSLPRL